MGIKSIHIPQRIHFTGIKGIAMSALAAVSCGRGDTVTGSDVAGVYPSDEVLTHLGLNISETFDPQKMLSSCPDLVIYTGAHEGRDNPEIVAARKNNIRTLSHGQALGEFMKDSRRISIAGCHGKTTTSAMVATILTKAGMDPSYAVGCGGINPIGLPGHYGQGEWFISEADEYITDPGHDKTPRFLWQHPDIVCITNIDYDHPDAYKTLDDIIHAYNLLTLEIPGTGTLIINGDDPNSDTLTTNAHKVRVGRNRSSDWIIGNERRVSQSTHFQLTHKNKTLNVTIHVPGAHNVVNAAMAVVISLVAGCSEKQAIDGILRYKGTKRRFEHIGSVRGTEFYDDYAHHPHEIQATLHAARDWFGGHRIIVVFEPHTYSRTKALLPDFGKALSLADITIVTDIYASAREHDTLGVSPRDVVAGISPIHTLAYYLEGKDQVIQFLAKTLKSGDIIFFMGAGDIYVWGKKVIEALQKI